MNKFELYKEIKIPNLVNEVNSIFKTIDFLSKKNNSSKSLYSVNTINFLNETENNNMWWNGLYILVVEKK